MSSIPFDCFGIAFWRKKPLKFNSCNIEWNFYVHKQTVRLLDRIDFIFDKKRELTLYCMIQLLIKTSSMRYQTVHYIKQKQNKILEMEIGNWLET